MLAADDSCYACQRSAWHRWQRLAQMQQPLVFWIGARSPKGFVSCRPQAWVASRGGSGRVSCGNRPAAATRSPTLCAVSGSSSRSSGPAAVAASNCSCFRSWRYAAARPPPSRPPPSSTRRCVQQICVLQLHATAVSEAGLSASWCGVKQCTRQAIRASAGLRSRDRQTSTTWAVLHGVWSNAHVRDTISMAQRLNAAQ